ncbi:uncharacterized protein LOC113298148 [Papaver somniferum]|uniref:uncharacterized protein LOC113298148 n=1 Tax=Papaver somniferum TaxID=3469 RepID=UPI000E7041C0|nr:uncharacterized protein LOC113298148 [Papaver somniferum]
MKSSRDCDGDGQGAWPEKGIWKDCSEWPPDYVTYMYDQRSKVRLKVASLEFWVLILKPNRARARGEGERRQFYFFQLNCNPCHLHINMERAGKEECNPFHLHINISSTWFETSDTEDANVSIWGISTCEVFSVRQDIKKLSS